MHAYLLCALLTYLQQSAACWRVNVVQPAKTQNGTVCIVLIDAWLKQSETYYARKTNRKLFPMPQISCELIEHEPVTLPDGARWMEPGEVQGLIVKGSK